MFARKYLVQVLQQRFFHCSPRFSVSVGVSFKAFNYSTSFQPSLEVGDNSAGEVHEGSQTLQSGRVMEIIEENGDELISKTESVHNLQPQLKPDQEEQLKRLPLKVVVQSCVRRWFKEHLKNAKNGDSDAQFIVGQMICHGYGIRRDVQKGEEWLRLAPRRQKQSKESEKKRLEDEDFYFM